MLPPAGYEQEEHHCGGVLGGQQGKAVLHPRHDQKCLCVLHLGFPEDQTGSRCKCGALQGLVGYYNTGHAWWLESLLISNTDRVDVRLVLVFVWAKRTRGGVIIAILEFCPEQSLSFVQLLYRVYI